MPSAIFIDNDTSVLKSVKRTYGLKNYSYNLHVIQDAKMAFQKILTDDVRIVIADVSLTDFKCKTFYEELIAFDPSIIRISTTSDYSLMQSFNDKGQTHITFNKPVNTSYLLDWINSFFEFQSESCRKTETYFLENVTLKSYPEHILKISNMLKNENFQMNDLSQAINDDTNLRVKLLKFVNSSSFGFASQITDLKAAVEYLGVSNINNVIRYLNVFSIFEKHECKHYLLDTLPYLVENRILAPSELMDLSFIAKLFALIEPEGVELKNLNKTVAFLMFVLMIDEKICTAVRFSNEPENCKIENPILNALVLAEYLNDKSDHVNFLSKALGETKLETLKQGFNL